MKIILFIIITLFLALIFSKSFFVFLLELEALVLFMFYLRCIIHDTRGLIIILTIAVIEACLGLICLVKTIRFHGKDLIKN